MIVKNYSAYGYKLIVKNLLTYGHRPMNGVLTFGTKG